MFSLRTQFFVALLSISAVLTGALYAFFSYSFERGFNHYIEQKEIARAAPLIESLEQDYVSHGSWSWLQQTPEAWPQYLASFFIQDVRNHQPNERNHLRDGSSTNGRPDFGPPGPDDMPMGEPPGELFGGMPPDILNRRVRALFRTAVLLDSNGAQLAGDTRFRHKIHRFKLQVNGQTVGYLGLPLNPALRDLQDAQFAGDQTANMAVIALAAFVFALLAALPLSHFLTKRIHRLVLYVQTLSKGDYANKLHLSGQDEINTLAEHLNDLAQSLQQSEQSRRRWVADISHELRTPLAVLQADIEAMEDGVRAFDHRALTRLQQHTQRLTNLVHDLYDLSLTDIGALTYRKENCHLQTLLDDVIAAVKPQFEQQALTLAVTLTASEDLVFGDSQRLQQLFLNLLQNSLHYTEAPGSVVVNARSDAQQVIVTIADSPPGVDESVHEKLFERLYRGESSRSRASGGAGLGLSLCRNIVAAHNGTITISNSHLGGLQLTVTLPLSKA